MPKKVSPKVGMHPSKGTPAYLAPSHEEAVQLAEQIEQIFSYKVPERLSENEYRWDGKSRLPVRFSDYLRRLIGWLRKDEYYRQILPRKQNCLAALDEVESLAKTLSLRLSWKTGNDDQEMNFMAYAYLVEAVPSEVFHYIPTECEKLLKGISEAKKKIEKQMNSKGRDKSVENRILTAADFATTLISEGITPSKTRNGRFDQALRLIFRCCKTEVDGVHIALPDREDNIRLMKEAIELAHSVKDVSYWHYDPINYVNKI